MILVQVAQARGTFWSIPVHFVSEVGAVQRLLADAADQLARLDIQLDFASSASGMTLDINLNSLKVFNIGTWHVDGPKRFQLRSMETS